MSGGVSPTPPNAMPAKPTIRPSRDGNRVTLDINVNADPTGYRVTDQRRVDERGFILKKSQRALCSQDAPPDSVQDKWTNHDNAPDEISERIGLARRWGTTGNALVQQLLRLQRTYYNSGCRFRAVDGDDAPLAEWQRRQQVALRRLVKEVWDDRLITGNVVVFWRARASEIKTRKAAVPKILTLPAERCRYSDAQGVEQLWVKLNWKSEDLEGLDRETIRRYGGRGEVKLDEEKGEYFRVLKEARVGWGFAEPTLHTLFRTLAQEESLQVADNLWAFISRAVTRHFKVGHEIRNGPRAGMPTFFIDDERIEGLRNLFEGRVGVIDAPTNFDVAIEFPCPDGKRFDIARYQSCWQRIRDWSGAVGMLMAALAEGRYNDAVLDVLRESAHDEREDVGPFLEEIINEVLAPPVPVRVEWSDECFTPMRARLEMRKALLAGGPMSPQTALVEAGLDPQTERVNKIAWAKEPKEVRLPGYDVAHGNNPQQDAGGRPPGVKELGTRVALNGEVAL
jgi:hypothetical protein